MEDVKKITVPKGSYSYCYEDKFNFEDLEGRRLYLNCEIDENVIDGAVYHILRYNRIDKENNIPVEKRKPIILYINSPGGNVIDGYGLVDVIRESKTPVYTVNLAFAASMGFLIFIAGHKRYSMPRAEFLLHDGSTGDIGSMLKVKDRIEFETIQVAEMTKEYVLDRMNIDEATYNEKLRVEWYFLPDEAKKIGAVDYIIGKDCSLDEII